MFTALHSLTPDPIAGPQFPRNTILGATTCVAMHMLTDCLCDGMKAMELIDDAGNPPNLYVHLDTYHMNIEESSSEHAVGVCGDKLGYASHQPFLCAHESLLV